MQSKSKRLTTRQLTTIAILAAISAVLFMVEIPVVLFYKLDFSNLPVLLGAFAMEDTLYRVSTTLLPQLCDRQDAVQSAIEKALRKRDKLRDPAALEAWLTRILINECYLILRSRKRETPMDDLPERETAPDALPDVYELFTSLEEKYRLPMVLYYVEGYSVAEAAHILHLPQNTLKSRLHRGRQTLRSSLALKEVDG